MPGDYDITVSTGDPMQPYKTHLTENRPGPSKDDVTAERRTKNIYHNIAIDPQNMYLYRSEVVKTDKYGHNVTIPASNIVIPIPSLR